MSQCSIVIVRGSGDIGSAVACALYVAGFLVILHDVPAPRAPRRGMAFTDAFFDGEAFLEGNRAVLVNSLDRPINRAIRPGSILATVADYSQLIRAVVPDVIVDARVRKRAVPGDLRGQAELTIGLGPGFVAGGNCDVAVETSWEDLGRVITEGPTIEFRGEPRPIGGRARERYVYAPGAGNFRSSFNIGDRVEAGQVVASIDSTSLQAPLSGYLRGLTRDGVVVEAGSKVIEVDPREIDQSSIWGIAERPRRIAAGVMEAVSTWQTGAVTTSAPVMPRREFRRSDD